MEVASLCWLYVLAIEQILQLLFADQRLDHPFLQLRTNSWSVRGISESRQGTRISANGGVDAAARIRAPYGAPSS